MNSFRKHATAMMAVFSVANTVVSTAIAQPVGTAQQASAPAPARPSPIPPRPVATAPMTAPTVESNPCQPGSGHSVPRCALRYMRETSQRKLTEVVGDGSRPITTDQMRALDQIVVRLAEAQVASNLTPGFDPAPFLEWWRRSQQDMVLNGVALVVRGAPDAEIGPFFYRLLEYHQEAVEIAASQRPAYIRMLEAVRNTWLVSRIVEPGAVMVGTALGLLVIYLLKTSIQGPIMATGSVALSSVFTPLHNWLNYHTTRLGRHIEAALNKALNRPTGIDPDSVRGLIEMMRQQGVEITFAEAQTLVSQYRNFWLRTGLAFQGSSMESVRTGRASGVDALLLRLSNLNGLVAETQAGLTTYRIRRHQLVEQASASLSGEPARLNQFNANLHAIESVVDRLGIMNSHTPQATVQGANDTIAQHRAALIDILGSGDRAVRTVDEIVRTFRLEAQVVRQSVAFAAQILMVDRWYSDVTSGALQGPYREVYGRLRGDMSSIPALDARVLAAANEMAEGIQRIIADGVRTGVTGQVAASANDSTPAAQSENASGFRARLMRLLPGGRSSAPGLAAGAALIAPATGAGASGGAATRQGTAVENATRAARAAGAVR